MATLAGGRHIGVCLLHDDGRAGRSRGRTGTLGWDAKWDLRWAQLIGKKHELVAGGMRPAAGYDQLWVVRCEF